MVLERMGIVHCHQRFCSEFVIQEEAVLHLDEEGLSMSNDKGITLHPEFGVNPSLCKCFWCGEQNGCIALLGLNKGEQAPRYTITDYEPCDKCGATWAKGILFIEAQNTPVTENQPPLSSKQAIYPTGRWCVVRREAIEKMIEKDSETYNGLMSTGRGYVSKEAFEQLVPPEEALRNCEVGGHA